MAWSMRLQRTFSGFASGWAGVALLALRVTVGASAGCEALSVMAQPCVTAVLIIAAACTVTAGLAVTIGFVTPFACVILCLAGIFALFLDPETGVFTLLDSKTASLQFVVISAALIALGPGAASVDARTFGRREVEIRRTQRSDDP